MPGRSSWPARSAGGKNRRHATSDWMELEQERGISMTSAALEFELEGRRMALIDTPGHKDFSEDTYRALVAADSVVMVIDAGKGVETQTRKLFEVAAAPPPADPDLHQQARSSVAGSAGAARRSRAHARDCRRARELAGRAAPTRSAASTTPAAATCCCTSARRRGSARRRWTCRRSTIRRPSRSIGVEAHAHLRDALDLIRVAGTPFDVVRVPRRPPDAGVLRQRADQLRPRAVPARARRARAAAAGAA